MIQRIAYLSVHTTPLAQPGVGDAGGMNVYIDELARTMAERGIQVDVFTRRTDPRQSEEVEVAPNYRVVHVTAGPEEKLPTAELAGWVETFARGVIKWAEANHADYDLVHTHYWLSGWAGLVVKQRFNIPMANSFHTLGRIKEQTKRYGEPLESLLRIAAEIDVIAHSDCVIASTPAEFEDLIQQYDASPERLCTNPPGVDHRIFHPGSREEARRDLGVEFGPLLLFVGRIQPLKGLDVAVETLAELLPEFPLARLVVIGGPSGPGGEAELAHIRELAVRRGLRDAVVFIDPLPHDRLAVFYRAVDVLLVPSRSESFGLVAAEAQATGLPVVASRVGGLPHAISDDNSGYLVEGWDPAHYAAAARLILSDPDRAVRMSAGAAEYAADFSWQATADRLLELYEGITGQ